MSGLASSWSFKNLQIDFKSYIKDEVSDSVKYYGVSYKYFCGEDEPLWIIWREVRLSTGIYRRDYAGGSIENNKIWTNRTSYFSAAPGTTFSNSYSVSLDGINDYMAEFLPIMDLDANFPFSIAMWVKPTIVDNNLRPLFSNFTTKGKSCFSQNGRASIYLLSSGTQGLAIQSGVIFAPDVWTHCVITYDGSGTIGGLKIYAGGTESASTTVLNNIAGSIVGGNILQVGAQTALTRYFPGNMDEIAIYNKALTSTEVAQIYNGATATDLLSLSSKTNLVHWYRLGDGDIFPIMKDSGYVGPNVDLTAVNMSAASIVAQVP